MSSLHISHGGIGNGDKEWLEKAAKDGTAAPQWTVPKKVEIGDDLVIYVQGHGFFAAAQIASPATRRPNWPNRFGGALNGIALIEPPISLNTIRQQLPEFSWARFPRSITTPEPAIASRIRTLIAKQRKAGNSSRDDVPLAGASIEELRKAALLEARPFADAVERSAVDRIRSVAIGLYVLCRAKGYCEGCRNKAPFRRSDGAPYLEPHHTTRLADEGPDHPANVIALCPNCHRRAHYSSDATSFNSSLIKRLAQLERSR
jgi:hypothetical protein